MKNAKKFCQNISKNVNSKILLPDTNKNLQDHVRCWWECFCEQAGPLLQAMSDKQTTYNTLWCTWSTTAEAAREMFCLNSDLMCILVRDPLNGFQSSLLELLLKSKCLCLNHVTMDRSPHYIQGTNFRRATWGKIQASTSRNKGDISDPLKWSFRFSVQLHQSWVP